MFEGLTNQGREYMAKCLAENKPISFVKVKIGNGSLGDDEDPETFTDIKSLKKEVDIVEKTQVDDAVRLLIQIDNTDLEEGYFPREIGIYVQDGEREVLYWYINDGTETSWLPPASKSPVKFKYYINLMATNLETIIINWTGKELWVDREFLGKTLESYTKNGGSTKTTSDLEKELNKKASKNQLGRMIVGKGLKTEENGTVSVVSKNDAIKINDNDIQLETINSLTDNSITKPLAANMGLTLDTQDKGLAGGYSGSFPLTVANVNGIYLLPATGKFYVCTTAYNGSSLTAPNSNFEELSIFKNRNRLDNCFNLNLKCLYDKVGYGSSTITLYDSINKFDLLIFNGYSSISGFPRIFSSSILSVEMFKSCGAEPSSKDGFIRYKYISNTQIQVIANNNGILGFQIYGIKF